MRRTNSFALIRLESRQSFVSDMSLGMSMDVVELVIFGLLAIWGAAFAVRGLPAEAHQIGCPRIQTMRNSQPAVAIATAIK